MVGVVGADVVGLVVGVADVVVGFVVVGLAVVARGRCPGIVSVAGTRGTGAARVTVAVEVVAALTLVLCG
ncbi:hypothetical protein [Nocardia alni]|uniref:hypothetical protein n=1 Tax=Nocardia alni TaxID=2815723 RepID=UPI001C23F03F|nr:hypothetical protein [Nocardia alni]